MKKPDQKWKYLSDMVTAIAVCAMIASIVHSCSQVMMTIK